MILIRIKSILMYMHTYQVLNFSHGFIPRLAPALFHSLTKIVTWLVQTPVKVWLFETLIGICIFTLISVLM